MTSTLTKGGARTGPDAADRALQHLSEMADDEGLVQISIGNLADLIEAGKRTARGAVQDLIDRGAVEMHTSGRRGRASKYRVVRDEPDPEDAEPPSEDLPRFLRSASRSTTEQRQRPSLVMRSAFRSTVSTCAEFLAWARVARQNDVCIYHIGMIAADRSQAPELDALAGLVSILSETQYITPGQHSINLAAGRQVAYTATRSGAGYAPRAIINGDVTANQYRALRAIQARRGDQSAARSLRDNLGISEAAAHALLRILHRSGHVERGRNLAWVLTDQAKGIVV